MENCEDPDLVAADFVDDDEWEPVHDGSAGMSMHDRIHFGATDDPLERFLNAKHELSVKPPALSSVPLHRLLKLRVCFRVEPDAHTQVSESS